MISVRARLATIVIATLTPVLAAAAPAQAAGLPNCNANGGIAPCYEKVWVDGVQVKMRFVDLNPGPSAAPTRNFYVTAPQTATPQGLLPFLHDHVIGDVPAQNDGDDRGIDRVRYHGYFVLCSAQGISSGGCVPVMTDITGLGSIPLAKTVNGQRLDSADPIESPATAALLTLFDTGGEFIATLRHEHENTSQ
jgi:hypothetical protein